MNQDTRTTIENTPSYYAIIPAKVRYDNELKANEKLLYGEITALANTKGYCWATNDYFAKLYGTAKETVSRWISHLDKKGYIRSELIYQGKEIIERRIYIDVVFDEKINTPIDEKINTPIDEIVKDNNTSINNTSINNTSINNNNSIETIPPEESTQLKDVVVVVDVQKLVNEFRKKYKADLDPTRVKSLVNQKGIKHVQSCISTYGDFIQGRTIRSVGGDFFVFCSQGYTKPVAQIGQSKQMKFNFDERSYTEGEMEQYYTNIND